MAATAGPSTGRRLALAAVAAAPLFALAPLASRAQAPSAGRKRLALVGFAEMFQGKNGLDEVVKALGQRGFLEGRQIEVLRVVIPPPGPQESARGLDYLVPKLRELVLPLKPDVIVGFGSIVAKGMHMATRTIPIVTSVADPLELGLAESLARPGGNVTGLSAGAAETSVKVMETLKRIVPRAERVAIFHDSRPVATRFAGHYERAARSLGIEPAMFSSTEMAELIQLLRKLPPRRFQAALMAFGPGDPEAFFREALAMRLPLIGVSEEDAERGALAAYQAVDPRDTATRIALIVEQVLRGADPATTPFQFPQNFRLVINRRSAQAIGLVIPPDLLLRADRVIE
jgi:putative ABC transport system substrate-binding protein